VLTRTKNVLQEKNATKRRTRVPCTHTGEGGGGYSRARGSRNVQRPRDSSYAMTTIHTLRRTRFLIFVSRYDYDAVGGAHGRKKKRVFATCGGGGGGGEIESKTTTATCYYIVIHTYHRTVCTAVGCAAHVSLPLFWSEIA